MTCWLEVLIWLMDCHRVSCTSIPSIVDFQCEEPDLKKIFCMRVQVFFHRQHVAYEPVICWKLLRRDRVLHIFKLSTGQDDHAIMFMDDYLNQVGVLEREKYTKGIIYSFIKRRECGIQEVEYILFTEYFAPPESIVKIIRPSKSFLFDDDNDDFPGGDQSFMASCRHKKIGMFRFVALPINLGSSSNQCDHHWLQPAGCLLSCLLCRFSIHHITVSFSYRKVVDLSPSSPMVTRKDSPIKLSAASVTKSSSPQNSTNRFTGSCRKAACLLAS
ncbi:uncharacterized protein LOC130776413 isoform X3 [Actinidia eriantha]|uniref:uncharacterized protein LOC130776413 isoform X3 n=1 Tax=Actinidia eriantha TaxID=165200 RepID=UPI002583FF74|nr:uncharacterized protein LOC130776413 isoform X3 [Actinidia eriantha]